MNRIKLLIKDFEFRDLINQIEIYEKDRKYCLHGFSHGIDVARIAYIYCLEKGEKIDKETVYAMCLIHDLGRATQYKNNKLSHHKEGARIAKNILERCEFSKEIIREICYAIEFHKNGAGSRLGELLFYADKKSRNCFLCKEIETCYWDDNTKNEFLLI